MMATLKLPLVNQLEAQARLNSVIQRRAMIPKDEPVKEKPLKNKYEKPPSTPWFDFNSVFHGGRRI